MSVMHFNWSIKKRLLSSISILSASLLLTGEFFSCCRINEALAKNVAGFIDSIRLSSTAHSSTPSNAPPGERSHAHSTTPFVAFSEPTLAKHAHCHGHGPVKENQTHHAITSEDQDHSSADLEIEQDGNCISDMSITKKSMVSSEAVTLEIINAPLAYSIEPILTKPSILDRPRPQNKSSPPLYLLNLQILV